MTQFCIISGPKKPEIKLKNIKLIPVPKHDSLYKEVIAYFQVAGTNNWILSNGKEDVADEIFSEANYQIASGDKLSDTRLGKILGGAIRSRCRIIAWYACEYKDLDMFNDPVLLVDFLYKELPVGSGDIYIDYK